VPPPPSRAPFQPRPTSRRFTPLALFTGTPGLYEVSSPYATSEFTFSRFSQPLGEAVRPRGQHHGDRLALDENAVDVAAL